MGPSRKNISEIIKDRVNYSIKVGYKIEVEQLIYSSINYIIKGTTSMGLAHPSLIYALCVNAGVRGDPSEKYLFFHFSPHQKKN
ncbi:hypothetical protein IEQ34_003052 [Dendrobium chrysotoxum]|uniref:Uncharacterized protein n=1 Tax=Dendrobium chrysotoxum TaxID=161865 RepID=A0AAV7HJD8_DENCH|nr:hypothetical protein IEQ34_003052 [Dendrobium chrysotoxum]